MAIGSEHLNIPAPFRANHSTYYAIGGFFLFLISCFIFLTFQTQKILFFQTPRFSFQNSDSFFSLRHTSNIPSPWVGTILIYQRYFSQIQDLDSEEGGEENAEQDCQFVFFEFSRPVRFSLSHGVNYAFPDFRI